MVKLEANLQFMFNEYDLIDRYEQAAKAGFKGVELQAPYSLEIDQINEKLEKYNLKHVIINLPVMDPDTNLANIALRPDRKDLFLERLDLGLRYASSLGCLGINTGIGTKPEGFDDEEIYQTLIHNQKIASQKLFEKNIMALIEPINIVDQPGFFINTSTQGIELLEKLNHENAYLLYDVYHMQIMEGDLVRTISKLINKIGHIQIADNPGRNEPGTGEINYSKIFQTLDEIQYEGWVGCEYKPYKNTLDSISWINNT
ncbi:MAG: hydroxypyruvate isomerase [Chloroflexi bacterium]|nr:hydroxypyruvate isomerase [Chloroflexota bacterium]|tara:strand:- start:57480 stop:58253 length:774 start_codon:yes stop_codon:yes gene_type:complete